MKQTQACLHWSIWNIWTSEESGERKRRIQFKSQTIQGRSALTGRFENLNNLKHWKRIFSFKTNIFRLNRTRIAFIGQSGDSGESEASSNLKRGFQWQGLLNLETVLTWKMYRLYGFRDLPPQADHKILESENYNLKYLFCKEVYRLYR